MHQRILLGSKQHHTFDASSATPDSAALSIALPFITSKGFIRPACSVRIEICYFHSS
jgi:hypothetical protein